MEQTINITDSWQRQYLKEFRKRKKFSLFLFVIVNGVVGNFIWTGKWFKFITVLEQKIKDRYLDFDSGLTFQYYWKPWKENWVYIKIVDNEKNRD
jgi:hypothetical protein